MYSRQTLTITFPPPGFFLVDVRLQLQLDGNLVYDGGFRGGFAIEVPVSAGRHTLTTTIGVGGPIQRRREYPLDVLSGQARSVVLRYSRFWGNFTSELVDAGAVASPVHQPPFRWAIAGLGFVIVSPLTAVLVFVLAVKIAPPYTPEGYAVMPTGQLLLALLLAPIGGAVAGFFAGRARWH